MGAKIKNQGYNVRENYLKLVYTNCWGGVGWVEKVKARNFFRLIAYMHLLRGAGLGLRGWILTTKLSLLIIVFYGIKKRNDSI